jgi:hypothetical protein
MAPALPPAPSSPRRRGPSWPPRSPGAVIPAKAGTLTASALPRHRHPREGGDLYGQPPRATAANTVVICCHPPRPSRLRSALTHPTAEHKRRSRQRRDIHRHHPARPSIEARAARPRTLSFVVICCHPHAARRASPPKTPCHPGASQDLEGPGPAAPSARPIPPHAKTQSAPLKDTDPTIPPGTGPPRTAPRRLTRHRLRPDRRARRYRAAFGRPESASCPATLQPTMLPRSL